MGRVRSFRTFFSWCASPLLAVAATWPCFFLEYISKFQTYILTESAKHQNFTPHLTGLLGKYCQMAENFPLKRTIIDLIYREIFSKNPTSSRPITNIMCVPMNLCALINAWIQFISDQRSIVDKVDANRILFIIELIA